MPDSKRHELWQAYDDQGRQVAGPGLTRQQAREGRLHGAAHVWIWGTNDRDALEILVQKRAATKRTWPGFYDISAAGHIDAGEDPVQAAIRETGEELGLVVGPHELYFLFTGRCHDRAGDSHN